VKKTSFTYDRWGIEVTREGTHRFLVDFEEQSIFAAKVLEDGTFGNAQSGSNVAHPGGMVSMLSELSHRGIDDFEAFALGSGARHHAAISRRRDQAALHSCHS
jgi:hypothetical protein